jgi:hypothetical protein
MMRIGEAGPAFSPKSSAAALRFSSILPKGFSLTKPSGFQYNNRQEECVFKAIREVGKTARREARERCAPLQACPPGRAFLYQEEQGCSNMPKPSASTLNS